MTPQLRQISHEHGVKDIGVSRFAALYVIQLGWVGLGFYLWRHAWWPSSCLPTSFWRAVTCSIHLPGNRGLVESGLMVWMWSTAMVAVLALSRLPVRRH